MAGGDDQFSYLIYRDMQRNISVQRDTLVIALQSNFQVHTVNYGVVWLGRLQNLGGGTLTRDETTNELTGCQ